MSGGRKRQHWDAVQHAMREKPKKFPGPKPIEFKDEAREDDLGPYSDLMKRYFNGGRYILPDNAEPESTIKDPDITDEGEIVKRPRSQQPSPVLCDVYDYHMEEYLAYVKRPLVVNGVVIDEN